MDSPLSQNHLRRPALFVILSLVAVMAVMLMSATAWAAILLEQTNSSTKGNTNVNNTEIAADRQQLGTGLNYTITGATLAVGGDDDPFADFRAKIVCYDDAYLTENAGCSSGIVNVDNVGIGKQIELFNFGAGISTNSTKYYAIKVWCYNNCNPVSTDPRLYGSNTDLYPGGGAIGTDLGTIADLYFRLHGTDNAPPADEDLTYSAGIYRTGDSIPFLLTWENFNFDVEKVYFYEDVEETAPLIVRDGLSATGGSIIFTHAYPFAGSYYPMAALATSDCIASSTGALTGSGCEYRNAYASSIEILSPTSQAQRMDQIYGSIFTASKTVDVLVNEEIIWTYDLNDNLCTYNGDTVTGRRLFMGFPRDLAYTDSGSILSSNSGALTRAFTRTAQPYSDFFFPYIHIYCSGGGGFDVYLGGSLNKSKAQMVSVYDADDVRFAMPPVWYNCAATDGYGAGTGTMFCSDKRIYMPGEPVKLKWVFNEPWAVERVRIFSDTGSSVPLSTLTDVESIKNNTLHYGTISYATPGGYQPWIATNNVGDTLGHIFFLGGETLPNPDLMIWVTDEWAPMYINSGAVLGPYLGTGGLFDTSFNDAGIFAWSDEFFRGFGSTGNPLLDGLQTVFLEVVRALLWVVQRVYVILRTSALFSFFNDIIHPAEGTYQLGNSLFNVPIPALAGKQFTVSYNDAAGAKIITFILQLTFMLSVFWWAVKHLLFHRHSRHR